MDIEYIPGGAPDFIVFIKSLGDKALLKAVDGHFRWVITRDDGTQYIARPEEARPKDNEPQTTQ